jgi:hypothetical protein
MTSSRRSFRRRSGVDHSQMCRLLLGGQRARAGEAWSCTSPHADVTQVAIPRRPCRLLLPMPTLLTACTRGTGHVTCRPRWGATPAAKRGNRRLGRLPMRNGSRHGEAHQCESANACICKICHTTPPYERLPLAETFCGKLSLEVGFFQFLRNFHQLTAFEQVEMILYAALDPSIASKAKKGEFVKCLDHFDLLQSARN